MHLIQGTAIKTNSFMNTIIAHFRTIRKVCSLAKLGNRVQGTGFPVPCDISWNNIHIYISIHAPHTGSNVLIDDILYEDYVSIHASNMGNNKSRTKDIKIKPPGKPGGSGQYQNWLVVIAPPSITPGSTLRPPLFGISTAAYLLRPPTANSGPGCVCPAHRPPHAFRRSMSPICTYIALGRHSGLITGRDTHNVPRSFGCSTPIRPLLNRPLPSWLRPTLPAMGA